MTVDHSQGWIGRPVRRIEDPPLLTGEGHFVADLTQPGLLHAVFVRSPLAHARILGIDVDKARSMPGVVTVITAENADMPDLVDLLRIEGLRKTPQPPLARDRVRFVGEPLAVVVAEHQALAEDAAEQLGTGLRLEPLPVVTDVESALATNAPLVSPSWATTSCSAGAPSSATWTPPSLEPIACFGATCTRIGSHQRHSRRAESLRVSSGLPAV